MKCPRCGFEMILDAHRKIPLNMCYKCGYIEGRTVNNDEDFSSEISLETNYLHMKTLNFNELVAFLASGLDIDEDRLKLFLESPHGKADDGIPVSYVSKADDLTEMTV